jgi:hypothetical protein
MQLSAYMGQVPIMGQEKRMCQPFETYLLPVARAISNICVARTCDERVGFGGHPYISAAREGPSGRVVMAGVRVGFVTPGRRRRRRRPFVAACVRVWPDKRPWPSSPASQSRDDLGREGGGDHRAHRWPHGRPHTGARTRCKRDSVRTA